MFKMRLFPTNRFGGFEQAVKQHPHWLNAWDYIRVGIRVLSTANMFSPGPVIDDCASYHVVVLLVDQNAPRSVQTLSRVSGYDSGTTGLW